MGIEDDNLRDAEWPDESDMDRDMFDRTEPCPYCKKPIDEEAQFCHHCGKFISSEDHASPKSLLVVLGVSLCLIVVVVVWIIGR